MGDTPQIGTADAGLVGGAGAPAAPAAVGPIEAIAQYVSSIPKTFLQFIIASFG